MGEIFKLKINIGNANIELEGEGSLVHTIFSELREFGLGKLSNFEPATHSLGQQNNTKVTTREDEQEEAATQEAKEKAFELPNIKDIVMKNLPKTEAEWVLVYALYASNMGSQTFTADDLRQMYHDTNRYTENRRKNFTTNIKKAVTSDWFNCINENDYALTEAGKNAAYEVIQRSAEPAKQKAKKQGQSFAKMSYQLIELGLDQGKRDELKQYIESFEKVTNTEKALLIANWLKTHGGILEVNEHTIFSALKTMAHNTSFDIRGALNNGRNRGKYFTTGDNSGYFKVHHIGEDHIRELEKERG